VRVRVDESWKDVFAGGIDDLPATRWGINIAVDARDGLALTPDVGDVPGVASYNFSILDQQAHGP
jgi:hypothetical protein